MCQQLFDESRRDAQHAIDLAPRLATAYYAYGYTLYTAFLDFRGAQQAYAKAAELEPDEPGGMAIRAKFDAVMGHGAEALAVESRCPAAVAQHLYQQALNYCADAPAPVKEESLAIAFKALNRPDDAREQLDEFMKRYGDSGAYQYGEIYAQWGEKNLALQ